MNKNVFPSRMVKPQLPAEIEDKLPMNVLASIYKFVPHIQYAKKKTSYGFTPSPRMETDLKLLQSSTIRGKNDMWLRDLEDFMLD